MIFKQNVEQAKKTALDKDEWQKVIKPKKNENTVFEQIKVPLRPFAQKLNKRNMMVHDNLSPGSTKSCVKTESNEEISKSASQTY